MLLLMLVGIGASGQETGTVTDDGDAGKKIVIVCDKLDESGMTSAHEELLFLAENHTGETLSDIQWQFILPLKEGGTAVVGEHEGYMGFVTSPLTDMDMERFAMDENTDIHGTVCFTARAGSDEVSATCPVILRAKPIIRNVEIIRKESNAPYDTYNVYYTVEFYGANYAQIITREGGSPILASQFVDGPGKVNAVTKNITKFYKARLEMSVKNKYGKAEYVVELPPFEEDDVTGIADITRDTPTAGTIDRMEIYDMSGVRGATLHDSTGLASLGNGIYLIRVYDIDGNVKQYKYLKK